MRRKEGVDVAHKIMGHKSKNSHLCGTSLVKFGSALALLPLSRLIVPSKIDETVPEVSLEFSLGLIRSSSPGGLVLKFEITNKQMTITMSETVNTSCRSRNWEVKDRQQ